MHTFFPEISPYKTGHLKVDDIHSIYWEVSGNPKGKPILFVHGGPGSNTEPLHRRFFDPSIYQIVLFDQRGCGKSTPHAELTNNTTWDLVEDIEKLRSHLKIDKWHVFGGSWGSTLALAYAIKHPKAVKALILRGIFLCRKKEILWFNQSGANNFFPDAWERYLEPIPQEEQGDLIKAYYQRLTSPKQEIRKKAAYAWAGWEATCAKLIYNEEFFLDFVKDEHAIAIARIECHYFIHQCFFPTDNWILDHIAAIHTIPCIIVNGRYDMICPIVSAFDLHKAYPGSQLVIIPNAGHSAMEEGITDALIKATNAFKHL